MDDQNFDQKTALEWMSIVESEKVKIRDSDIYPLLGAWLDQTQGVKVLEIGCGQGACSEKLSLAGRSYIGVDPSPYLIERAKQLQQSDKKRYLLGNVYDLPFEADIFDAAFSVAVWHLLSDLEKAANELSRVLKEKGHFLIITANPQAYSLWKGPSDVIYQYSQVEVMSSLQEARLEVQSTETFRNSEGQDLFISIKGQKH